MNDPSSHARPFTERNGRMSGNMDRPQDPSDSIQGVILLESRKRATADEVFENAFSVISGRVYQEVMVVKTV